MANTEFFWALMPASVDSVFTRLRGAPKGEMSPRIWLPKGEMPEAQPLSPERMGDVALIRVEGPMDRQPCFSPFSGERWFTGYGEIGAALDAALADEAVSAILFAFNSPGGAVAGCKELADKIRAAASEKPCAAYADGLCASAAFWLASATGRVFAPVTASVGSIGVLMVHEDDSRAWDSAGVSFSYITGGKFKAAGSPHTPLSAEDRSYLERHVAALHAVFREDVARSLGLNLSLADAWGDGQIAASTEALRLGLVSRNVLGLSEAITLLSKETLMNREELAARHPELLAEIMNGCAAEKEQAVREAAEKAHADGIAAGHIDVLALVGQAFGEEAKGKLEALLQAGVTPEQMRAVAAVMAPRPSPAEDVKARLLAGIEKATTGPLPDARAASFAEDAAAAVERMAKL